MAKSSVSRLTGRMTALKRSLKKTAGDKRKREAAARKELGLLGKPSQMGLQVMLQALDISYPLRLGAFDALQAPKGRNVDIEDLDNLKMMAGELKFIEIKTTSRDDLRADFKGFYFSLSESQIEAALALGEKYRFALYNIRTKQRKLLSLEEILARATSVVLGVSVQI